MVFCGIYPADGAHYQDLREALARLQLNDASLTFEPETSAALGFGFRCGFLGLLHMEIVQERLEREYDLDLITTAPSVIYRITLTDGTEMLIDNPTNYPEPGAVAMAEEPLSLIHICDVERVGAGDISPAIRRPVDKKAGHGYPSFPSSIPASRRRI